MVVKRKISPGCVIVVGVFAALLLVGSGLSESDQFPHLKLTKSVSPTTITVGDVTTVIIEVKNTGNSDAKDISVRDEYQQDYFDLKEGKTSYNYPLIKANDSRKYAYKIMAKSAGNFTPDSAIVTYKDEKDKDYSDPSNNVTIVVKLKEEQNAPGFEAYIVALGILIAFALRKK